MIRIELLEKWLDRREAAGLPPPHVAMAHAERMREAQKEVRNV